MTKDDRKADTVLLLFVFPPPQIKMREAVTGCVPYPAVGSVLLTQVVSEAFFSLFFKPSVMNTSAEGGKDQLTSPELCEASSPDHTPFIMKHITRTCLNTF